MKVYVDKLPSQCVNCRFRHKDLCCITNDYFLHKDCPLQSLTDYTKQVRKEVVQEIRRYVDTQLGFYNTELDEDDDNYAVGYIGGLKWLKDVLEQIQGGDNA